MSDAILSDSIRRLSSLLAGCMNTEDKLAAMLQDEIISSEEYQRLQQIHQMELFSARAYELADQIQALPMDCSNLSQVNEFQTHVLALHSQLLGMIEESERLLEHNEYAIDLVEAVTVQDYLAKEEVQGKVLSLMIENKQVPLDLLIRNSLRASDVQDKDLVEVYQRVRSEELLEEDMASHRQLDRSYVRSGVLTAVIILFLCILVKYLILR
ncbi:hypothetical protein [Brevibacillus dissolubilis]|uniref:hypothetical protein n=1 Tax=Brevibacillus dissolubilis TaxID=1844116 RepID=UPI0011168AF1|nr:hypothetical protein [Brevibacillus dissolubilis]